jgi:hypothetical protein
MRADACSAHGFGLGNAPCLRAFSEEVDTGSSKENAVNQELRATDLIQSDRQPL